MSGSAPTHRVLAQEIVFGISGTGEAVGRTLRDERPVYRFSDCEVTEIKLAEPGTQDWHEILFFQNGRQRVLSTRYKKYLESYQRGDSEIFTVYMGGRHYVHSKDLFEASSQHPRHLS